MQKMISLTDHPFDGLALHPGDKFEAGHQYVDFLLTTGCARLATASDDVPVEVVPAFEPEQKDISVATGITDPAREMTGESAAETNPLATPELADPAPAAPRSTGKRPYNRKAAQ